MKKLLLLLPIALFMYAKPMLDADYDRGEELILVERKLTEYEPYSYKYKFDLTEHLFSIYYDDKTTNYYFAEDGTALTKTNGLTYKLDPKKAEKTFGGNELDPYLQYVGYISTNQRLYIDKRDKQQYIKILEPIKDTVKLYPSRHCFEKSGRCHIGYVDPVTGHNHSRVYLYRGVVDYAEVYEGL